MIKDVITRDPFGFKSDGTLDPSPYCSKVIKQRKSLWEFRWTSTAVFLFAHRPSAWKSVSAGNLG